MKKLLPLLIAAILILCSSCSDSKPPAQSNTNTNGNVSTNNSNEEIMVGARQEIGDFIIEVKSYRMTQTRVWTTDYDIIVVSYEWTNNSGGPRSFEGQFQHYAFQDGIACKEHIFVVDGAETPTANDPWREVQSGKSQTIQKAYELLDATSDVSIEIGTRDGYLAHTIVIDATQPSQGTDTSSGSMLGAANSKPGEIVVYEIPSHEFVSEVPDFLWFATDGEKISIDTNCEIEVQDYSTVSYRYDDWSDDVLKGYKSLLLDTMGFELNYESDDGNGYVFLKNDIYVWVTRWEGLSVDIAKVLQFNDDSEGYNGDDGGYDSGFRRTDYFTGISYTDLMRYPDTYTYSKVYFERLQIKQVYEPKLYLVQGIWDNKYYIVDDRGSTGPNGLVEDVITGYGVFYGIETVNWDNGRSDQVPFISADRLIFSRDTPTDFDDFAHGLVDFMNIDKSALTYDNQYLGNAKVRINAYKRFTLDGSIVMDFIPKPARQGAATNVDGQVAVVDLNGAELLADYWAAIPPDNEDHLVWITGTIVSIERIDLAIKVTLDVESIEPIE